MICGGAIATFDYAKWVALFPALSYVSDTQAQMWFGIAGEFYLRNDGTGRVRNQQTQQDLLNLITAHLVQLFVPNPANGPAQTGLVGRIASATEGSVTVSAEYAAQTSASMAFWVQTQYGAAFWAATAAYRTGMYVPGPRRFFGAPWPSIYG